MRKWRYRLSLFKVFIGAWILLLLVGGVLFITYAQVLQDACIVRHRLIIDAIKASIEKGEQVPADLLELSRLEYVSKAQRFGIGPTIDFEKEHRDLKYEPSAWNNPGKILLQSSVLGKYVVTFGDGSRAVVLSYWQGSEENINPEHILRGRELIVTPISIAFFCLLLMSFFAIAITERIISKKEKASQQL